MRILTRTQYDAICDIVIGQKKIIEKKEAEIKRLKAQVERLSYLLDAELAEDSVSMTLKQFKGKDIDFPNSSKSYEDKLFKEVLEYVRYGKEGS